MRLRPVLLLHLLLLPPLLVSDLPLLLLVVDRDAPLHVLLELAALPRRQLVQLELKDLARVLVDALTHDVDDATLLLGRQLGNRVLKVVLLGQVHWLVGNVTATDHLADGVLNLHGGAHVF